MVKNKVTKEFIVDNPITGEKKTMEITAVNVPDDYDGYTKLGIDLDAMVERAFHQEIENKKQIFYYDTIKDYCLSNSRTNVCNCNGVDDFLQKYIMPYIDWFNKPEMFVTPSMYSFGYEFFKNYRDRDLNDTLSSYFVYYGTCSAYDVPIKIYVVNYNPWKEMTCLFVDESDPKNSMFVEYKNKD
jgi:hypothetical protein